MVYALSGAVRFGCRLAVVAGSREDLAGREIDNRRRRCLRVSDQVVVHDVVADLEASGWGYAANFLIV